MLPCPAQVCWRSSEGKLKEVQLLRRWIRKFFQCLNNAEAHQHVILAIAHEHVKRSQYVIPIQCVDHRVSAFCGHSASIRCMIRSAKITASARSEEHTSELQSLAYLVCRLLLEKK